MSSPSQSLRTYAAQAGRMLAELGGAARHPGRGAGRDHLQEPHVRMASAGGKRGRTLIETPLSSAARKRNGAQLTGKPHQHLSWSERHLYRRPSSQVARAGKRRVRAR